MRFNNKHLIIFMMICLLVILMSTAASAILIPTDYITFARQSFTSTDGLTLSGTPTASLDTANSRIRVVPNIQGQTGGVFTTNKVNMDADDGFSMAAKVYCGTAELPADGFALVLSTATNFCTEVFGSGLGYSGMMPNNTAVQCFTYLNDTDYSNTYIALGRDGNQNRDASTDLSYNVTSDSYSYFWLDYDADSDNLYVYSSNTAARPASPVVTYSVDLSSYTLTGYYIGITAATGGGAQEYAVEQWYYDAAYHSDSLLFDDSVRYSDDFDAATVWTKAATAVTGTSATLNGVWGSNYASGYTKGFEYKIGADGEVSTVEADGDGAAEITDLEDDTAYYYRAYAQGETPAYGDWREFTTLEGFSGSGTEADPYQITSEDDLNSLATLVNDGNDFDGEYFIVTQDITMSDANFAPIGRDSSYPFSGTFDGNGKTITDLHINVGGNAGLFGYLDGATVTDLTISGATINGTDGAGAIVGYADNITITGCTATGCDIDSVYNSGGIAGYIEAHSTVYDCSVSHASVNAAAEDHTDNYDYAGGIVGYVNYQVNVGNCGVSDSTVSCNNWSAGGIAGAIDNHCNIVKSSVNDSTVSCNSGDYNYVGGISGWCDECCTFACCTVSNTDVISTYDAGGITSWTYYSPQFINCIISGGEVNGGNSVGGIAGYLSANQTTAYFSNCQVTTDLAITTTVGYDQYIGGIVANGDGSQLDIENCEFNGTISAVPTSDVLYAGGLVGYNYNYGNGASRITNCVAYGTVTAAATSSYIGGIIGYSDDNISPILSNNVAMQSSITGIYANSLYANSNREPTVSNCYANTSMVITSSDTCGAAGAPIALSAMNSDSDFWTSLDFTAANGWEQTTDGNVTAAPVEAHLVTQTYTLTVTGAATPYLYGIKLTANSNGTYTVCQGAPITMACNDGDYKISGVTVNGTAIDSPWSFTVTGNTTVVVSLEENSGDFWFYDGEYVYGVYDEDSDYDDIDWTDAVDSSSYPLSGSYTNANVYVLGYESVYIDQLNLGRGSIIAKEDCGKFYLYGANEDSYLIADSIVNEYDSGDVYIGNLDVYANTLYINDQLVMYGGSNVMSDTVTIVINSSNLIVCDDSSLTTGTIYAAVDSNGYGASIDIYDSGVLTADNITGALYFQARGEAVVNINNDLETTYFEIQNNAKVTIGGDLTTTYYGSELYDTSLVDVGGTITTADGINIYSLNAAILNADSDSDTPYYNGASEDYIRTTLTGLPANTIMEFVTSGGDNNMEFYARTNYAGILTVWLIPDGGTITAYTYEGIEYVGTAVIGNVDATIAMVHTVAITDVTVTADVPEEQVSGQPVSYDSNIAVVCDNPAFVYDGSYLDVYLMSGNTKMPMSLATELPEGTYYLTVCYNDETNDYYGTATYTVHVRDQRTISFNTNGGSSINDVLVWKYDSLTLPTSTRSGYRLAGWSDGAITFTAGSDYQVYVDTVLTAQWVKKASSGNAEEEFTITASAGEGGSISPDGSVKIVGGESQSFTITPDQGYVIDDVTVDGKSVGALAKYTFSDVTAAHSIKATFAVSEEATNPSSQFSDLVPGAWYEDGINYVLTAGLFNGTSATQFSPNADMTRGMLVTVLWRLNGTTDTSINSFDDVEAGLWYSDAVKWAAANGIVSGFGNNMFRPNDNITREQMALILYNYANFMGYDTTQTASLGNYSDNSDISDWAAAAMAWANATGLISGRTDTTLAPGGTATRAEVATILMRFIEFYSK